MNIDRFFAVAYTNFWNKIDVHLKGIHLEVFKNLVTFFRWVNKNENRSPAYAKYTYLLQIYIQSK